MNDTQKLELETALTNYKAATDDNGKIHFGKQITHILASEFTVEAKQMVQIIEDEEFPTTRGNYAKYMQVLNGQSGFYRLALIKALIDAGAGQGLQDAMAVM